MIWRFLSRNTRIGRQRQRGRAANCQVASVQRLEDRILLANAPAGYELTLAGSGSDYGPINQMAFHPDDPTLLFATVGTPGANNGRIMRYDYDPDTGQLSNPVEAFSVDGIGDGIRVPIGLGFQGDDLWISRFSGWPAPRPGAVTRLQDTNDDGIFDQHTDFITGIILALPGETSHTLNQIEIHEGSLYVGIGTKTNDGSPAAEDAYNGTIVQIPDLANPVVTDLSNAAYLAGDFLNTAATDGRAHLYARGFRNPYGIRFDASGQMWVSDNGADAGTDDNGGPFAETPDLIYKDVDPGDVAKFPPPGEPGGGSHTIEPLAELDFNTAPGGFAFIPNGPDAGDVLIAMTSGSNGRTVAFLNEDGTGFDREFIDGFGSSSPIGLIPDSRGRLLIANRDAGEVYTLVATTPALIQSLQINGAANPNRSGIRELTFSFSDPVTIDAATSLSLFNHTTGQSVDLSGAMLVDNGTAAVSWDLSGVALADGRYTAELSADAATPGLAQTFAAEFFKLAGDVSGNAAVNLDDFSIFGANFSTSGAAYKPGDVDGDGTVNLDDFSMFGANFSNSLPVLAYDFGDAPDPAAFPTTLANDGARHVITGNDLYLGASRDGESDGVSSGDASGDDAAGSDDENGLTIGDLERGTSVGLTVTANVPTSAVLNGWIDFNRDGDWRDAGEQVFTNVPLDDGTTNLNIDVPADAALGATIARFRLTETGGYSYFGLAPNGEVEDYQLAVIEPPAVLLAASQPTSSSRVLPSFRSAAFPSLLTSFLPPMALSQLSLFTTAAPSRIVETFLPSSSALIAVPTPLATTEAELVGLHSQANMIAPSALDSGFHSPTVGVGRFEPLGPFSRITRR